jgi:hypothetical protein
MDVGYVKAPCTSLPTQAQTRSLEPLIGPAHSPDRTFDNCFDDPQDNYRVSLCCPLSESPVCC